MSDISAFDNTASAPPKNRRIIWGLEQFWWVVISFWVVVSLATGLEVELLRAAGGSRVFGDIFSRLGPWLFMTVLIMRISSTRMLDYETWKSSLVIYLVACALSMGVVGVFAFCGPMPPFIEAKATGYTGVLAASPRDLAFFILARITSQLPVFWGLVAVAHAVRFYERDHLRKLRETELRTQLAEARLQALQLQLNPHFLFNTLNSIAALVNENPATAERMIVALGDLLRMTLATSDRKQVTIREELHLLDQYLLIERIRFGGRLKVETQIDETLLDDLVPVFILQPLAENAVKHGVENQLGPALIQITAESVGAGDLLLLEITNDGPASDIPLQTIKERVGLSNARSRLQAMFGSQASLKLLPGNNGGFTVRLMIPRQGTAARPPRLEPQTVS
jgi:two-component system LytT family sensor kinase